MNFDHERIVQQRRRRHQNEIRSPESDWRYAMAAKRRLRPSAPRKYRPFADALANL
jgi:hypothetical protein